jgi:XapX domain-containing protein
VPSRRAAPPFRLAFAEHDMKPYLFSLGAGLLVGVIYNLLGVRSPAPPAIALVGLLGILLGEQIVPVVRRVAQGHSVVAFLQDGGRAHVLGRLPSNNAKRSG